MNKEFFGARDGGNMGSDVEGLSLVIVVVTIFAVKPFSLNEVNNEKDFNHTC
ncbi:MAG: hypothetical protein GY846_19790 [Deltaproteobacteria bacterium]|nr:hypothetical protein [Deltaproteobacteria bacterium]